MITFIKKIFFHEKKKAKQCQVSWFVLQNEHEPTTFLQGLSAGR